PEQAVFILTSSKQALLFKTIISRCRIIRFAPLARHVLEEIMVNDFGIQQPRAHFLGYFSEGRIGYALALRETDLLGEKNRIINEFIFSSPGSSGPAKEKEDLHVVLNVLATWFRDIYMVKTGLPHSELINLDRRDELLGFINRYGWPALDSIMNTISESLLYLERNVNTKLLLSNVRAQICQR
ncbi:MAG: DNA polymerase III subunit delta' C-terminal domain-containing protein, partial [Candidatus Omnitrophica bacterium]|nr:DNA polymerase III subunit delta' C-terminal domain-containing protein [Candidatus Omnitrophota bacterium]